jgi:hypothetical protein
MAIDRGNVGHGCGLVRIHKERRLRGAVVAFGRGDDSACAGIVGRV